MTSSIRLHTSRFLRYVIRHLPTPLVKRIGAMRFKTPILSGFVLTRLTLITAGDDVISRGIGKGIRINAAASHIGYVLGTTEPKTQEALRIVCRQGWTCYDVGANVGFFSLILGRLTGPTGQIFAFEPLPDNIARLEHNISLNPGYNIRCLPLAIGKSVGAADFLVAPFSTQGRLLSVNNDNPVNQMPVISVAITSIDQLVCHDNYPAPNLIKIDVEGAELDVVDGMESVLFKYRPVLFCELHGHQQEMAQRLNKYGYTYVLSTGHEYLDEAPWWTFVVAAPNEKAAILKEVRLLFST
jgi:FkbM family methyltransferase